MGEKQTVIVIVGPTASGKSALAVELARRFNGEIISADSRQVYKGLDVGTGKITKQEMKKVRHHLLDVISPQKVFSAADYVSGGRDAIENIAARGRVPIICGGTGFYIDALLERIVLADVPANHDLREKLSKMSISKLFSMLKKLSPEKAKTIDRHNPVRLIRAIEIAKNTKNRKQIMDVAHPYISLWIGLRSEKKLLRNKIRARLLTRVRQGMVREARQLHAGGLSWKRMEALGLEYRYLALFLQNKISKAEMLTQLEAKIWQYAKRQMTYWRRNYDIKWFAPQNTGKIHAQVKNFLSS
jgi:tRNA dimethylallyltransferase